MAPECDASTLVYDNSLVRPGRLVDVLSMDVGDDIPSTLLDSPEYTLGTAPVDSKRYYTQEFFDLENTRMWPRVWQYACWSYDIPNPGDTAVYRNAGESALVVMAYLAAYALFLDEGHWSARLLRLAPFAAVVVVWRVFYAPTARRAKRRA